MFYAARVEKNLHVQVAFVPFVVVSVFSLVTLVAFGWGMLWLGFERESMGLRQTLRHEIAGAMSDGFEEVMVKHTARTMELQNCRAELESTKSVNKDLARMTNTKMKAGGIGGTP